MSGLIPRFTLQRRFDIGHERSPSPTAQSYPGAISLTAAFSTVQEITVAYKSPNTPWPEADKTDHGVFGDNNFSNNAKGIQRPLAISLLPESITAKASVL